MILSPAAGDDSSNEDQGEEREDEDMEKKNKKAVDRYGVESEEVSTVPEEDNMEAEVEEGREEGSGEEELMKNEESEEFSFPDTTISLSHLQPSR